MGEPVGEEYAEGDLCAHCWGFGKPFGDVPTPLYIYVTITGLTGACLNGNDTYTAKQQDGFPCLYKFNNATHSGWIEFRAISTWVYLQRDAPFAICINFPAPVCFTVWNPAPVTVILS